MATQICPQCKSDSFTWHVDDNSTMTTWSCSKCGYQALENESDERVCIHCGKKTETKLQDKNREYWWCSNCNQ